MRIGVGGLQARRERQWRAGHNAFHPVVLELEREHAAGNRRALRVAVAAAVALHLLLFATVFPEVATEVREAKPRPRLHKLQQVRIQPPRQSAQPAGAVRPTAKRIPIPDPTPDDPEPIARDAAEQRPAAPPAVELGSLVSIPEGPPGPPQGPLQVTGSVQAPQRIFAPDPVYPEDARQARVQGVVILQTIIDALGKVSNVRVLKGLPSGLSEAAVAAVTQWQFRPATLDGRPVAVYYLVTITFSVQ